MAGLWHFLFAGEMMTALFLPLILAFAITCVFKTKCVDAVLCIPDPEVCMNAVGVNFVYQSMINRIKSIY